MKMYAAILKSQLLFNTSTDPDQIFCEGKTSKRREIDEGGDATLPLLPTPHPLPSRAAQPHTKAQWAQPPEWAAKLHT